jgi:hypothetical protein
VTHNIPHSTASCIQFSWKLVSADIYLRYQNTCKYQLFFFAGNSVKLRAVWESMSVQKKQELAHFDRKYKSISVFLSKSYSGMSKSQSEIVWTGYQYLFCQISFLTYNIPVLCLLHRTTFCLCCLPSDCLYCDTDSKNGQPGSQIRIHLRPAELILQ